MNWFCCIGDLVLLCFQQASPFIFTKVNSVGPLAPTPTTDTSTVSPVPDSTDSDFTHSSSSVPDSTGSQPSGTTSPPEFTNTTSPEPSNTTPSQPECPADIPVWVPVVVGVCSLVAGFAAAGIIFSCLCQKKKDVYLMEMRGTGF